MTASLAAPTFSAVDPKEELKDRIGPALGKIASGVYIATVVSAGVKHGLLATWVAQASFYPPKLTLAINKERPLLDKLAPGTLFTLNVLSSKNMDIFKKFAAPTTDTTADRFDGLELADSATASGPVFADAVGYLDLRVETFINAGDHIVVLAEITGGGVQNAEPPMTHIRKNGFSY